MVDGSINIPGRGTVATGTIESGKVKVGDEVNLIGIRRKPTVSQVTGLEAFRKSLDYGEAGDSVGVLLKGLLREQVSRGMCLVEPGKYRINRHFKAQIYVLKTEEGGRHKPFFSGYRPQCFLRTADSAADLNLLGGKEMAMPGDNLEVDLKLYVPICMDVGNRFALREGGKTVAAGVITEIIPDTDEDVREEENRQKLK